MTDILIAFLKFVLDVVLLAGIWYLLPVKKIARVIVGFVLLMYCWPLLLFILALGFVAGKEK